MRRFKQFLAWAAVAVAVSLAGAPALAQVYIPAGNKPIVGWDFKKQTLDAEFGWAAGGTDARATTRTVLRGGTEHTVAANTPAYGDDGLSIEPAATNLLTYSEQFDSAVWNIARITVSADVATSPDGESTADKLVEDSTNDSHVLYRSITLSDDTDYTFSIFAKAGERAWIALRPQTKDGSSPSTYFDLSNGVVGATDDNDAAGIEALAGGWYRCWVRFNAGVGASGTYINIYISTGDNIRYYQGDGSSGLYLRGAQLEAGTVPTAYIPTTTSTVSRAADAVSFTLPQALKDILSVEEPTPTSAYDETNGAVVLSTVDGTAFVMPDQGSGADLSPYAGTHVIKVVDSAGKVAWGYLSDAGTGETLGSELVVNGTFDSDISGWTDLSTGGLCDIGWDSGRLDLNGCGTDYSVAGQVAGGLSSDKLYKSSLTVDSDNSGHVRMDLSATGYGNAEYASHVDVLDATFTDYWTAEGANLYVRMRNGYAEHHYWDNVSVKQVTAPPATGCWVVSTPGGSTKNWAYIQSGFNPNDIASYDLYPISQWRAEGTLVVREVVPGFSYTDVPDPSFLAVVGNNSAAGWLHWRKYGTSLHIDSYNGTLSATLANDVVPGVAYDYALRWSAATGLFQVGYKLSTAAAWTWGNTAAFDGAFTLGSNLNIGYSPSYPFQIGRVIFYDKWLSESMLAWLDELPQWVACADDYWPARAVAGM